MVGLGGVVYLKYYEYSKINHDIDHLMSSNELAAHLYETNQQSAFSIDSVMDAFERGYNQFSVSKYRETLAGLTSGKVTLPTFRSSRPAPVPTETCDTTNLASTSRFWTTRRT
jgi:hypothetical protein